MPHLQPKPQRFSIAIGVTLGLVGTILGFLALLLLPYFPSVFMKFIVLLCSFALLTYFSHCLAHYIAGKAVGLKFSHYIFGASRISATESQTIKTIDRLLPRLGIRLTKESRKNATHHQRNVLFSSGVITSTLLPLIPTTIGYVALPYPQEILLPVLWIAYLAFGIYFSPRFGDLSRIKTKT